MPRPSRDRNAHWLSHLRRCEKSRGTSKEYAERVGLSMHALYMARSRLKSRGLWPEPAISSGGFVRVEVVPEEVPTSPASRFSIDLASGARMHWEQAPDLDQVVVLASVLGRRS
jgi:hypothetical protein